MISKIFLLVLINYCMISTFARIIVTPYIQTMGDITSEKPFTTTDCQYVENFSEFWSEPLNCRNESSDRADWELQGAIRGQEKGFWAPCGSESCKIHFDLGKSNLAGRGIVFWFWGGHSFSHIFRYSNGKPDGRIRSTSYIGDGMRIQPNQNEILTYELKRDGGFFFKEIQIY